jgi:hypothetical protein
MHFHHWLKLCERGIRRGACGIVVASLAIFLAIGAPARAQLIINPIWDSTITSDPNAATIKSTISSAISVYETRFSDPISVSIKFQETGSGLASSSTFFTQISYSQYLTSLTADQSTSNDTTALAHLPAGPSNPVNGNANIDVTTANMRALGFNVNPPIGDPDSTISLNTSIMNLSRPDADPTKYDLFSAVSHEIDEALGVGSGLTGHANIPITSPSGAIWGLDLYRYDQNGNRSYTTNVNAQAFFSIDGGATQLARFNQNAAGDFNDWFSTGPHTPQVQDAFGTPGATPNLGVELTVLDVLGYNLVPTRGVAAAPEPGTLGLMALPLSGAAVVRVRRRRQRS